MSVSNLRSPQRVSVLLADDDPSFLRSLAALLHAHPGIHVVGTATSAAEAAELAERHQPDVVLLDVGMPGGGADASVAVRSAWPPTRVIAVSGRADREAVVEMITAGAIGYVVKGSPAQQIVDAVLRAHDGDSTLSGRIARVLVRELAERLDGQGGELRQRSGMRERITQALDANAVRFALQPITELDSGVVVGFEALARFGAGPDRAPTRWLWEAEQVDLGVQLELMAVRTAVRLLAELPAATFLSVNASPACVSSPAFASAIAPAAPERLVVEITERSPVESYAPLLDALQEFRLAGGRLAIDDAGAGYASLQHVLRLRPDLIKLDRSLTSGIDHDPAHQALATALVGFAAETGAQVVAEGIESSSQMVALRSLRVPLGQGYFLGRPAEPPEPPAPA